MFNPLGALDAKIRNNGPDRIVAPAPPLAVPEIARVASKPEHSWVSRDPCAGLTILLAGGQSAPPVAGD
jgi:hypothetical protein